MDQETVVENLNKKFFILLLLLFFSCKISFAESRFGELTEMFDERMRGKDDQWVRPHPGPFVWNKIEKKKEIFLGKKLMSMLFMHKNIIKL